MGGGASTALPVALTLVLAPLGGLLGAVIVRRQLIASASAMRTDLRHQLSAYLDLVTMLVSGQSGHESALEQATGFGDGRLFTELRSSFRRSVAAGGSMVDGLRSVGERFDIVELDQVAASIELADSDGAPIARSLGAKCATLRSTLASEHELEARLRTSRLTAPIVGMSLVFMVLVIYPAMAVT
jgi:Flp pilus assembly protein TadB